MPSRRCTRPTCSPRALRRSSTARASTPRWSTTSSPAASARPATRRSTSPGPRCWSPASPSRCPGTTLDRQCGSSQQAVHFAAQGVIAGAYDVVIACGVESMSRVPDGHRGPRAATPTARSRPRFPRACRTRASAPSSSPPGGSSTASSSTSSPHARTSEPGRTPPRAASTTRSSRSRCRTGAPHTVDETVRADDDGRGPRRAQARRSRTSGSRTLYPEIDWLITPGNSSPLTDGASAALIMSEEKAAALGLTPRARFHTFAVVGSDPEIMLTGADPGDPQGARAVGARASTTSTPTR